MKRTLVKIQTQAWMSQQISRTALRGTSSQTGPERHYRLEPHQQFSTHDRLKSVLDLKNCHSNTKNIYKKLWTSTVALKYEGIYNLKLPQKAKMGEGTPVETNEMSVVEFGENQSEEGPSEMRNVSLEPSMDAATFSQSACDVTRCAW